MSNYFKELQKECENYHKLPQFKRLRFLYDLGFNHQETMRIMNFRKFSNEKQDRLYKRVIAHPFFTNKKISEKLNITSGEVSNALTGYLYSKKVLDKIEKVLDNYDKNLVKKNNRNRLEETIK